jgi:hypothetical protein
MAVPKLMYSIGNAASTTLSVAISNVDTSATITSDTNFAAKSGAGMVLLDEGTSTEEIAYSASKSGATLSIPLVNRGLEGGSAQAHASGTTVKGVLTAGMWNDLIDSLLNVLSATTGAVDTTKIVDLTTAQTLTNKRLTSPKINENVAVTSTATELNILTGVTALVTASTTNTFTNKRITKRVGTTTSSATPTINTDNYDMYTLTAQAGDISSFTTNLSGTPTDGQTLWIAITGTAARAISWGTSFESSTVTLPTTTVTTARLDVGLVWNAVTSKWRCVASV